MILLLLQSYVCLAVHCYMVMYAWLCIVAGLYVFDCTWLQGYVCMFLDCCKVMYAWLYTVTGLCMLGCTLLQDHMRLSAHCYRIIYVLEAYCIYPNVRQPCV